MAGMKCDSPGTATWLCESSMARSSVVPERWQPTMNGNIRPGPRSGRRSELQRRVQRMGAEQVVDPLPDRVADLLVDTELRQRRLAVLGGVRRHRRQQLGDD